MKQHTYRAILASLWVISCGKGSEPSTGKGETTATTAQTPSASEKSWQLTPISLKRVMSFDIDSQIKYEAHPDYEFVVVEVGLRPMPGTRERTVSIDTLEIHDANGVTSKCAESRFVHDLDKHGEVRTVHCEVPVGTLVKSLRVGQQSLDLTKLQN